MNTMPIFYNEEQEEEIQNFICEQWGTEDSGYTCHEIKSEYVHTDIKTVGGKDEDKVFVTFGVGAREMNSPLPDFTRIEFLMYASPEMCADIDEDSRRRHMTACSALTALSKYPFRNDTWLGPGHTIDASERFAKEFGYQYFLFAEYCDTAILSDIGEVHFLIAIPVFEEERNWMVVHENGSQRFLSEYVEHFEFNGIVDDMFKIDIPRKVIIPSEDGRESI